MKFALLVMALVAIVHADMYLHNPRGSNNRLDEARRDRNNGNRLFDSQNNNRGGYNVGSLYYYAGSVLPIEWTNQHSCGDPNNHCEIIFQYMCDENVRDGASTQTIPTNPILCEDYDCNTDLEYGMHESYDYYVDCALRERNRGLFTADRNLRGTTARHTRQNENGNRRGYECPEERDHYPYWHPTPWRDIAVLTNNPQRCPYYQAESANVKSRFSCVMPSQYIRTQANVNRRNYVIPSTQQECESWSLTIGPNQTLHAVWQEFKPDPRLSAPECVESLWSRDNHLGNGVGGYANLYNWTIPDLPHEHCVFRARYNISTGEYDGWNSSINSSIASTNTQVFNEDTNMVNRNRRISTLDVYSQFGFNYTKARARGYVFRQNPVVKVFDDPASNSLNFGLQLAINTNQFGRTFQDRSHTFSIRSQPADADCANGIYNLNVRGKRGNIVQVYPGVEYDFVPNDLQLSVGSCVHIQWTGSNTNPNNNDGQGRAGTDRSNMVLLRNQNYPEGTPGVAVPTAEKRGHFGNSYPQHLNHSEKFLDLNMELRGHLAMLTPGHMGGEMSELDDAGTYFDLGLQKVTSRGTYYYMCSRNNNFTNRSQKGKVIVNDSPSTSKRIGWNGGAVQVSGNTVTFNRGALNYAQPIVMVTYNETGARMITNDNTVPGKSVSSYVRVGSFETADGAMARMEIPIDVSALDSNVKMYVASPQDNYVFRVVPDSQVVDGKAVAQISGEDDGNIYVAASPQVAAYVVIATVIFVVLIIVIIVVGMVVFFRVRRDKWKSTKDKVSGGMVNIKRSFAGKV